MTSSLLSPLPPGAALREEPLTDPVQVLRYSALFLGVFYGFYHQRTINASLKEAHAQAEYKHKESLIEKAKLEWAKKSMPASEGSDSMWLFSCEPF